MQIVTNTTKLRKPSINFEKVCRAILPKKYKISIVFISGSKSKKLNKLYRHKDKSADVLSFPISKDMGEIFIDIENIKRESRSKQTTQKSLACFLLIHGLLHLQGHKHGYIMESMEKKFAKKFNCVSEI